MSLRNSESPVNVITPRVLIRGTAVGISGVITKQNERSPKAPDVAVHGSSTVPLNGGVASETITRLKNWRHKGFFSFGKIETVAQGSYNPARVAAPPGQVATSATITDFELVKRFRAKRLKAALTLAHPGNEREEPTITWNESEFTGITLDKYNIDVHIDRQLQELTTQQRLIEAFHDPERLRSYEDRFFRAPGVTVAAGTLPRLGRAGYLMFSIVDKITTNHPKATVVGHVVRLEGFGEIRFGEILVLPESRRLTLAQFNLGCANGGRMLCADVVSQGEFCPP